MFRKKSKLAKRVITSLLAVLMIISMMPVASLTALAANGNEIYKVKVVDVDGTALEDVSFSGQIGIGEEQTIEVIDSKTADDKLTVTFSNDEYSFSYEDEVTVESINLTVVKEDYKNQKITDIKTASVVMKESGDDNTKFSLSFNGLTNATVTFDGKSEENNTYTANDGEDVEIIITPEEGYYVKSFDGKSQSISSKFSTVVKVEKETTIPVVVTEAKRTVSVGAVQNGTVTVKETDDNSIVVDKDDTDESERKLTVDDGKNVSISVTPEAGYWISSVVVTDSDLNKILEPVISDSNKVNYQSNDIPVTDDLTITVTFIKYYTVEISYSGDGVIDTAPEGVEETGKVKVEALSGAVKVTANPNDNYRVTDVVIDGIKVQSTSENKIGKNDETVVIDNLSENKNHTISVTFAPNVYNVTATSNEEEYGTASVSVDNVEHNGEATVTVSPKDGYRVTGIKVNDSDLNANGLTTKSLENNAFEFTIDEIQENKKIDVIFEQVADIQLEKVVFDKDTDKVWQDTDGKLYIYKNGTTINFSAPDYDGLKINGKETNKVTESVKITELKVNDKWWFFDDWQKVTLPDGGLTIIIDDQKPTVEIIPEELATGLTHYSDNVDVSVNVSDVLFDNITDTDSGIDSVTYEVLRDGNVTQSGELFKYSNTIGDKVTAPELEDITVDVENNNSDNVKVVVTVIDRAGNETVAEKELKICTDKPQISLAMTGDLKDGKTNTYYKSRTLNFTVTDRAFNQNAFENGLIIKANSLGYDFNEIKWIYDGNSYTGSVELTDDARYVWELNYTNNAGLTNDGITCSNQDVYDFIIDNTVPEKLEISYDITPTDYIIETLTFGVIKADEVTVTVSAEDKLSGIDSYQCFFGNEKVSEEDLEISADKKSCSFKISAPINVSEKKAVSFIVTDKAGNACGEYLDGRNIVVDNIAPGVVVEFVKANENDDGQLKNGKYYVSDQIMKIKITEDNFYYKDITKDGKDVSDILVVKVGEESIVNDLTFTLLDGVYVAEYVLAEEAEYTISAKYKDLAGNEGTDEKEIIIDKTAPKVDVSFTDSDENRQTHTVTITVEDDNFNSEKVESKITLDGVIQFEDELKDINNWKYNNRTDAYEWTKELSAEGKYSFGITVKDMAEHTTDSDVTTFILDNNAPENLSISYKDLKWFEKLFNGVTFGFSKEVVKVTLEATDELSGIQEFSYSTDNGATYVKVETADLSFDGKTASYKFDIAPQYRNKIMFKAVDKSGNSSTKADDKVVVVDSIAPGIDVSFDNEDYKIVDGKQYFDKGRTATIEITEANFFQSDIEEYLIIKVTKNGVTEKQKPTFKKISENIYEADIVFDDKEAEYKLDVSYTDRAGNTADSKSYSFVVDQTAPVVNVTGLEKFYCKPGQKITFEVDSLTFNPGSSNFIITAKDSNGDDVNLNEYNYAGFLMDIDNWTKENNKYTASIELTAEATYYFDFVYSDNTGVTIGEKYSICIDNTPPEVKVTYDSVNWIEGLIDNLFFGFFKNEVKVVLTATDDTAGIEYFMYTTDGWETQTKVDSNTKNFSIDGNTAEYWFEIPAQYRDKVSFTAYDKAGNPMSTEGEFHENHIVVVDNIAPGVTVDFINTPVNVVDGYKYYIGEVKAKIVINESNFFQKDVEDERLLITVEKVFDDGTTAQEKLKPEFVYNETNKVYEATVEFDGDADYIFDVKYTDRSGNVYDKYEAEKFTLTNTKPVIDVSFDNNTAKKNNQFKEERTATIKITEHNFAAENVVTTVIKNSEADDSFAQYLMKDSSWTHSGNVHTATITFSEDAHYEFDIKCTDLADNLNETVNYGDSVAPNKFTVDKTAPTALDIKIGEKSLLGTNEITFKDFYSNEVTLKIHQNCDVSGLDFIKYQKVENASDYKVDGNWVDYTKDGIKVVPNEKFVIFFYVEDNAGNGTYANSKGIVVDNQKPVGELSSPEIDIVLEEANSNGMYKDDVTVDFTVIDPKYKAQAENENGNYSGLKSITYKVSAEDINATEEGTLFTYGKTQDGISTDKDNLVTSWKGSITIDANKFNSNNVVVLIEAVDNAGNTRTTMTKTGDVKIDTTAPEIDIAYDNNSVDSGKYFSANRTVTISLTERNFNANDVEIIVTRDGKKVDVNPTWSMVAGSVGTEKTNLDETVHEAKIPYTKDGDYKFSIAYTDLAGNKCTSIEYAEGTKASDDFTIDKTNPVIKVTYDNNDVKNGNYYKAERTATIQITEHNFNTKRVNAVIGATDDGATTKVPVVSKWNTQGDVHTATVYYPGDARYTFDIDYTDLAGNKAADYKGDTFFVDKTKPTLKITNVSNDAAYAGKVAPVVSYSDTNFDKETVKITLRGANRGEIKNNGTEADAKNGAVFTFANFENIKSVDDIYTLTATLTDKAGNTSTETVRFSVNRFGSTYELSKSLQKYNGAYVQSVEDIVITEVNANRLENIKLTLFKNSETIVLKENTDYKITVNGGGGSWYSYTYTVFKSVFSDDGVYRLSIHSEDAAGNIAENTLDTKDKEISFGIDTTLPNIVVANLKQGETYPEAQKEVKLSVNDNMIIETLTVYFDDSETPFASWTAKEIADIVAENGEFKFVIPGDNGEEHKVRIVCVDAAGNTQEQIIDDFYVTTNKFVQFYNNKALFFGSIGGGVAVIALVVFFVVKKRKSK